MKYIWILILVGGLYLNGIPQSAEEFVPMSEMNIGTWVNGKPINSITYSFPESVYSVQSIDSIPYMLVLLRKQKSNGRYKNKGIIMGVEKKTGKILFQRKTNFHRRYYTLFLTKYVESSDRSSTVYSASTGKILIEIDSDLPLFLLKDQMGFGYKWNSYGSSDTLYSFDLEDGSVNWKAMVPHKFGWSDYKLLDDSLLLIAADGLIGINVRNGISWEYEASTGKESVPLFKFKRIEGIQPYFKKNRGVNYGDIQHYKLLCSNIETDSTNIYFVSIGELTKLDLKGNVLWSEKISDDYMGRSSLIKRGDTLLLVNYGFSTTGSETFMAGIPFVAAYNCETGDQLFFNRLKSRNTADYLRFSLAKKYLYVLSSSKIACIDITNGKLISEKKLSNWRVSHFIKENEFIFYEDKFLPLNPNPDSLLCLAETDPLSGNLKYIQLETQNFNSEKILESDDRWSVIYDSEDYLFISQLNQPPIVVLDKKHNKIATIDLTFFSRIGLDSDFIGIKGEKLYFFSQDLIDHGKGIE